MKPEAYSTGNVSIATMLVTLGCRWWKNHNGTEIPCTVQYDLPLLKKLIREFPELNGMDIVEGTKLVHSREKPGVIRYLFEWSELLQKLINSWNKHEKWIKTQGDNGASKMEFSEIEPDDAARLFCQWSKNRKEVANLWKQMIPDVVVYGDSELSKEQVQDDKTGAVGERTVRTGSLKIMSVNANMETRERMGI